MSGRQRVAFQPDMERVESRELLSTLAAASEATSAAARPEVRADHSAAVAAADRSLNEATGAHSTLPKHFLIYRITIPSYRIVHLVPPFQQVLVQKTQPVPGRVYNVLFVAVQNGTGQTFMAANDFQVRLPGFTGTRRVVDHSFPVLTGNQVWKPKTWIVFYVLSKSYYPLSPQAVAGFQLDTGGRSSTLVPGPSGIFLRLTYDPATFAKTLNWIVAYGQGAQLGAGSKLGLPDTAINELVAGSTNRIDFAGHF